MRLDMAKKKRETENCFPKGVFLKLCICLGQKPLKK